MDYELGLLESQTLALSSRREWLLTNGTGGYAMGTVAGCATRKYHGHLVAATKPPTDRMVLLADVDAYVHVDGRDYGLSANQYVGTVHPDGYRRISRFRAGRWLEWDYLVEGVTIRKRVGLHPGTQATTVRYENLGPRKVGLILKPLVCHKPHHENFRAHEYPADLRFQEESTLLLDAGIPLVLNHEGMDRTPFAGWYYRFEHQREADRGLDPIDDLYCPCELHFDLAPGDSRSLVAALGELAPAPLDFDTLGEGKDPWHEAGRHFICRVEERSTIIAGYPWFTDWGRDTMISIPGLCLARGEIELAKDILRAFAGQMNKGLIPNRFVEAGETPEYHTVDASLWFIHAIWETLAAEWDDEFASEMMARLQEVIDWHRVGTLYGIRVDPSDDLLTQGQQGWQLTWMDAKVDDWVVTPRHGKPVEINGLWVNALHVASALAERLGIDDSFADEAQRAAESFQRKFWSETHGWYFDTVDPLDAQLRPNQLIAMSLPFGPAKGEQAGRALAAIERELLTPYGLRTLGPQENHYHGRFEGPLPSLDAAYHQGTVWPWLLGPYVDAVLRVSGDADRAKRALQATDAMLDEFGMGGIAEVYDGDAPHRPNGCPWQAWSVAEIYRVRKKLGL